MRKVTVLCVGRLKEPFYEAAAAEYVKRLGRFCKLEIVELAEQRLPENPSPAEVARGLAKEAEAIRAKLPPAATVVALCVEGRMKSSEELAKLLEGSEQLACIIGGSFGLDPSIKAAAQLRLSMSPMTFPHHLARVMLLEQIYRAYQINGVTRYHK